MLRVERPHGRAVPQPLSAIPLRASQSHASPVGRPFRSKPECPSSDSDRSRTESSGSRANRAGSRSSYSKEPVRRPATPPSVKSQTVIIQCCWRIWRDVTQNHEGLGLLGDYPSSRNPSPPTTAHIQTAKQSSPYVFPHLPQVPSRPLPKSGSTLSRQPLLLTPKR